VETIQRNTRCYLLSKQWAAYLVTRTKAIDRLQRTARRYLAYKTWRGLLEQRYAEWEQLWDVRRGLLYYYNYVTGASQYNEPDAAFRPLVRDPLSAALMQAWPAIDNRSGALALLPTSQEGLGGGGGEGSGAAGALVSAVPMVGSHTHCGVCKIRKCVRICTDCIDEVEFDPAKYHAFPYCFTCFMKAHLEDNEERANHQYSLVSDLIEQQKQQDALVAAAAGAAGGVGVGAGAADDPEQQQQQQLQQQQAVAVIQPLQAVLRCCRCDEPATRKCLGQLDEEAIEKICSDLKRTHPSNWVDVLKTHKVASDRKLTLLLDQIRSENTVASGVEAFKAGAAAGAADRSGSGSSSPGKAPKAPLVSPGGGSPSRSGKLLSPSASSKNGPFSSSSSSAAAAEGAGTGEAERESDLNSPSAAFSSSLALVHLQSIRGLLERSKAECDECYCAPCYAEVHTGGKRALHKWLGFQARAAVCTVCNNCPAELNCLDCECQYCSSCFKVFHGMGRKRAHKKEKVLEEVGDEQDYCGLCSRRAADTACSHDRCQVVGCDSCIEFRHKPQCNKDVLRFMGGGSPGSPSSKSKRMSVSSAGQSGGGGGGLGAVSAGAAGLPASNAADFDADACVVCGQPADLKCVQCGDCYCSNKWMGNPGCFAQHHARGNRAAHTTELFMSRKAVLESMQRNRSKKLTSVASSSPTTSRPASRPMSPESRKSANFHAL
jgi:hypothetical protein